MGKYTGEDLIRAIELNGYRQGRRYFVRNSHGVTYACAIGQGMLNTGLDQPTFMDLLSQAGIAGNLIMSWNDTEKKSIAEIAKRLRILYPYAAQRIAYTSAEPKSSARKDYQGIKVLPRNDDFRQAQSVGYHNKRDAFGRFTR